MRACAACVGQQLQIFIDEFSTNEPIVGANVEIVTPVGKVQATDEGDGVYTLNADWVAKPGKYELMIAVETGKATEVLAGTLTIAERSSNVAHARPWLSYAKWAGAVVGTLLILLFSFKWLCGRRKAVLVPALFFTIMLAGERPEAFANGDEEHTHTPAAKPAEPVSEPSAITPGKNVSSPATASVVAAKRLPDGSVFMPKATQRMLG
ncbi:MAG TPA: hypothetical protein VJM76_03080, partial [Gammaproteobacteria bacterium]|nr:hypothetical protein [Gammaproteobacteria bacterium]